MIKTNVADAKAKLSEYLERVRNGERVVICRHNTPVAELRPYEAARTEARAVGVLPGRPAFDVPPSFFEPLPDDELEMWEGRGGSRADRVAEDHRPLTPSPRRRPRRRP